MKIAQHVNFKYLFLLQCYSQLFYFEMRVPCQNVFLFWSVILIYPIVF